LLEGTLVHIAGYRGTPQWSVCVCPDEPNERTTRRLALLLI